VPIIVGIPILVVRCLTPGSTTRALTPDPRPAVATRGEQLILASSTTERVPATSSVSLGFRVRNLAMREGTLHWTVTTRSGARSTTVAGSGSLALTGNASEVVRVQVSCRAAPWRIDVSHGDGNQTIGVRTPCVRRHARAAPGTLLTFVNPTYPGSQRASAAVRFAFKVDNHTHVSQGYVWTVATQTRGSGSPADAATGHLTLPSYYFAVVPVSVRLACVGLRTRVSVALASATGSGAVQTISFQLPCRRTRA